MRNLILFTIILLSLSVTSTAWAGDLKVDCGNIYAGTLAPSGTFTYSPLVIAGTDGKRGFFSIQPVFTGSGSLKIEYETSNDRENWTAPVTIIDGATSKERYAYPASGVNIFAGYIRLKLSEVSTTDSVVITKVNRCVQ